MIELFRFDPPELPDADVRRIADELYGVTGDTHRLRGERSHNTRFTTADGEQYVLRVASASEPDDAIDFHAQALVPPRAAGAAPARRPHAVGPGRASWCRPSSSAAVATGCGSRRSCPARRSTTTSRCRSTGCVAIGRGAGRRRRGARRLRASRGRRLHALGHRQRQDPRPRAHRRPAGRCPRARRPRPPAPAACHRGDGRDCPARSSTTTVTPATSCAPTRHVRHRHRPHRLRRPRPHRHGGRHRRVGRQPRPAPDRSHGRRSPRSPPATRPASRRTGR